MNFVMTRAEIVLVTGLGRTQTFELQQRGKLKPLSGSACKGWFLIGDVLRCVANVRGLAEPDQLSMEFHAGLVVLARQKRRLKTQS